MEIIKRNIIEVLNILKKREFEILPGQLAFFFVLSIIPTITALVLIASFFSIDLHYVAEFITTNFPTEISDIINPFILGKGFDFNIGFFTLLGFYLASNGAKSIIVSSDMLYKLEKTDFVKLRLKSIVITIMLIFLFLLLTILLGLGTFLISYFVDLFSLEYISNNLNLIFSILKWPITLLLIYVIVNFLYTITPNEKIERQSVFKGSIFTSIGWSLATIIYTYYVANFSNYSIIYGGLSNLIVFMTWIYINAYIFVIGLAINANNHLNFMNKNKVIDNNNNDAKHQTDYTLGEEKSV